tara:strand:- start:1466 stop:2407 length:942 start_codon:yes stop_codon:yes gene_type:complete
MITINLTGNLGNHMWQYSVCRTIAEKLGYDWGISPTPSHDYHQGKSQMTFMDADFGKSVAGITHHFHEKWQFHEAKQEKVWFNRLDDRIYDIEDNTILLGDNGALGGIYQCEDYIIDNKPSILKWFKIKKEYKDGYKKKLKDLGISLDDNLCIINFRGGEYKNLHNVIPRKEYWRDSISHMLQANKDMKFLIITDDINCAKSFMPFDIQAIHVDIGFDFYVVNQAKWLIISNSSFSWWGAWLNQYCHKTIGPKYFISHNLSDGYWSHADSYTTSFEYIDREGAISDYNTCKKEAEDYYRMHNLNTYKNNIKIE